MDLRERPEAPFERHPWEITRARFVADMLRDSGLLPGARRVLDVGAGDGWLASQLARSNRDSEFVCWDRHYTPAEMASLARTNVSAVREAPSGGSFDLACALDVIEHVEDDLAFLDEIRRQVRPGGAILITVPAHQLLWTRHDELLEHHRRYSRRRLLGLIESASLELAGHGGFFHSLLVPRAFSALRERLGGGRQQTTAAGEWRAAPPVTRAVLGALRLDNACSRLAARASVALPGLSLWALCRRPS